MANLGGLAANGQGLCHDGVRELGRARALGKERDPRAIGQVHQQLRLLVGVLKADGVVHGVRAAGLGQLHPLGDALKGDELRRAGGLEQLDGGKADGAAAEHRRVSAGPEAARPDKEAVVGHARGLHHGAQLEGGHFVSAVEVHDVVELVAVFGVYRRVLGEASVIGQARLLQVLALVEHAPAAGVALAAPVHGLHAHQIAHSQLLDVFAHLHDFAGELVARDDGVFAVPVVHGVAVGILAQKVLVRAADARRAHLQEDLVVPAHRHGTVHHAAPDVLPDLVAAKGAARVLLPLGEDVALTGGVIGFHIKCSHNCSFFPSDSPVGTGPGFPAPAPERGSSRVCPQYKGSVMFSPCLFCFFNVLFWRPGVPLCRIRLCALFAGELPKAVILYRIFLLFCEICFLIVQLLQLRMVVCRHNNHAQYFIGDGRELQKF